LGWNGILRLRSGQALEAVPYPKHALTGTIDSISPGKVTARLARGALQSVRDDAEVTRRSDEMKVTR
jgi:hypothetical protein